MEPCRARRLRQWLPYILLPSSVLLLLLAFVPPLVHLLSVSLPRGSVKTLNDYTFVVTDYPQYYPLDLGEASLTPENTVHYQIYTEDAEREWDSVFPDGGGFLLLGPERTPFGLTLFHQMHCLVRIRRAMRTGQSSTHVHHCFNYLRQTILCEADSTLEPVVENVEGKKVIGESARVCRDWSKVYELAADNYQTASKRREGEVTDPMYA